MGRGGGMDGINGALVSTGAAGVPLAAGRGFLGGTGRAGSDGPATSPPGVSPALPAAPASLS